MFGLTRKISAGFSLIEVLVVSAVVLLIFGGLLASVRYTLDLTADAKVRSTVISVANDRMEYFRSLPYDEVGVVSGYPSGSIPQHSTTTLNGIEIAERVRVDYVDDPADGLASADENGIILDYKRVKLEYTWNLRGVSGKFSLVSNIVPRSIETTAGGGTARINVLNADSSLLPGASVRLFSSSSTFSYDVTSYTDSNGAALFNVPADSGYQVKVTADIGGKQYSTDGTYVATTSNPNPIVAPFTVLEADISTLTFQIGELSDLDVAVYSDIDEGSSTEPFNNLSGVASSSNATTSTGRLVLDKNGSNYYTTGFVYIGPIAPSTLSEWRTIKTVIDNVPANTDFRVRLYTGAGAGPYTLIPDSDLPGNSVGFFDSLVDISQLDASVYPSVYVGITLSTTDTAATPEINELAVYYREAKTALADTDVSYRGTKIIGTDSSLQPIYKVSSSSKTDGQGKFELKDLEFDDYTFSVSGMDIAAACPAHPFTHEAGVDGQLELVMVPDTTDTLRVAVEDNSGRKLPGAVVNLKRSGYDVTLTTDSCGQVFFSGGGLSDNNDYILDVSANGYAGFNQNPFNVTGDTFIKVVLTET